MTKPKDRFQTATAACRGRAKRSIWRLRAVLAHPLSAASRKSWRADHPRPPTPVQTPVVRQRDALLPPDRIGVVMQQTAIPDESRFPVTYRGFCPICEHSATFVANHSWYRDHLICQSCINGSVPRERALALVLNREAPNWRSATIHESSPAERGLSAKLALARH